MPQNHSKKPRPDSLEYHGLQRWLQKLGVDYDNVVFQFDVMKASDSAISRGTGWHRKTIAKWRRQHERERTANQPV